MFYMVLVEGLLAHKNPDPDGGVVSLALFTFCPRFVYIDPVTNRYK